jgi:hypothetical protein
VLCLALLVRKFDLPEGRKAGKSDPVFEKVSEAAVLDFTHQATIPALGGPPSSGRSMSLNHPKGRFRNS